MSCKKSFLLTTLFLLLISLTAGSTINWSTSSDWDNAVSNNVEHTSENVSIFTNNWSDDFSDGTCDGWTTVSGSWSCNNNTMQNTDSNNNRKIEKTFEGAYGEWSFDHRHDPSFYGAQTFYILPNGVSSVQTDDYHVKLKNSNSNYQRTIRRNENGDANTFINGGNFNGGWNSYKVKRYFNGTTYFYINDNYRGKNTNNSLTTSSGMVLMADNSGHDWDNFDVTVMKSDNGSITTDWKSFSNDRDPSNLELQNVDSILNGQNITVVIESDTNKDNITDETSDLIYLNGSAGPYSVSGLSSTSNNFRMKMNFATDSPVKTPTLSSVGLSGSELPGTKPTATNPSPNNRNIDPDNVELSIEIEDPDNDKMNLSFYDSSNNLLNKLNDLNNGTYSYSWNGLSTNSNYSWYAEINDGTSTTTTDRFNFTTLDLDISWTDNSNNENGFKIYTNSSGSFNNVKTVGENTESTKIYDPELETGKYTCIRVVSYNQFGDSSPLEGCITL